MTMRRVLIPSASFAWLVLALLAVPHSTVFSQTFTLIQANLPIGGPAALADFDNDGQMDLLVTGHDSSGRPVSRLLHNEGQGGFSTNQISRIPPLSYGPAAWGDYDNDGRLDLLLAGQSTNVVGPVFTIYRNNGDGTFSDIHAELAAVAYGSVALGISTTTVTWTWFWPKR